MQSKASQAARVINEEYDKFCLTMSVHYAKLYQEKPEFFISCFLKFGGMKMVCSSVVHYYEKNGLLQAGKENLKDRGIKEPDYAGFVKRFDLGKWKRVFEKTLNIIFILIN